MIYSKLCLTVISLFIFTLSVNAEWIEITSNADVLAKRNIKKIYLDDKSINIQNGRLHYAVRYFSNDSYDIVYVVESKGSSAGIIEHYNFWDYTDFEYKCDKKIEELIDKKVESIKSLNVNMNEIYHNMSASAEDIRKQYHPAYTTNTAKKFKEITLDSPLYAPNAQAWKIANEKNSATGVVKNTAKGFVKDTINDTKAKGIIRGLTNVLKEFDSY